MSCPTTTSTKWATHSGCYFSIPTHVLSLTGFNNLILNRAKVSRITLEKKLNNFVSNLIHDCRDERATKKQDIIS